MRRTTRFATCPARRTGRGSRRWAARRRRAGLGDRPCPAGSAPGAGRSVCGRRARPGEPGPGKDRPGDRRGRGRAGGDPRPDLSARLAAAGPLRGMVKGFWTMHRRFAACWASPPARSTASTRTPISARLLTDDATIVRARALRLIGELGRADLNQELRNAVQDPDETCRFWAAWSAGLIGERGPADPGPEAARRGRRRIQVARARSGAADHAADRGDGWLRGLNSDPRHARLAVTACGIIGDPAFVPWLIGRMEIPELARAAGESFSMITGVDLAYDDLETRRPRGLPGRARTTIRPTKRRPGPGRGPAVARPRPDPQWWQDNGARFAAGTRHLLGRPIDADACQPRPHRRLPTPTPRRRLRVRTITADART